MSSSIYTAYYSIFLLTLGVFFFFVSPSYTELTYFTPVFQLLLGVWLIFSARSAFVYLKESTRSSQIFIFLSALIWIALAVLQHPGFVNYDTFSLQDVLGNGELSTWNTLMYSLIVQTLFAMDRSLFLLTLLHVFIFIGCLVKCIRISPIRKWWALLPALGLSFLPLLQAGVLYISRDYLFGLLLSYLLLCFAEKYFKKQSYDTAFILKTLTLTFVASEMRQDAKFLLLAYPALIFLLDQSYSKFRKKLAVGALFVFSIGVNLGLLVKGLYVTNQHYQFSGLIHPLNYIAHLHSQDISAEQRETIQKVVDFNSLLEYDPHSILPFHRHQYTLPVSIADWKKFVRTCVDLFLRYPTDFVQERIHVLKATFNIKGYPFIFPDEFEMTSELPAQVRKKYDLQRWNIWPELRKQHTQLLQNLMYGPVFFRMVFGSPILLFILCSFLALHRSPFRRYYWVATLFYASRFPVVLLMAPEPQLKYYAPIMFFPAFALLIFDWSTLRRKNS